MRFLDADFVKGFIRMADDGWNQGWHERNGGNLSYRLKPEEVESVKEILKQKNGSRSEQAYRILQVSIFW